MHINLFTTCTSSGNIESIPELNGKNLEPFRTHTAMHDYWNKTIKEASESAWTLASSLYTGVSFRAAQKIASVLKSAGHTCDMYIMSIGFGLIHPEESIIPYNLSLIFDETPKSASMWRLIEGERLNQDLWWELINSGRDKGRHPVSEIIKKQAKDDLTIVTTSATFLSMVAGDIYQGVQENPDAKIVVLGPANTSQYVKAPKRLLVNGNILATDREKLALKIPGNKFDQAQRAGQYFVDRLLENADVLENPPLGIAGIEYGAREVKSSKDLDLPTYVREAKNRGLTEEMTHRELLQQGHAISSKAFHLVWDPTSADKIIEESNEVAALASLQNIGLVTPDNEDDALELLVVFKNAIVSGGFAGTMFGAKEMVSWAQTYCQKTDREVPGRFMSAQKLTHFVKNVGPTMNIYPAKNPKVQTASFQVIV